MVYPNIVNEETRFDCARQLWRWRKQLNEFQRNAKEEPDKFSKELLLWNAHQLREWIFGFRRALELIGDN